MFTSTATSLARLQFGESVDSVELKMTVPQGEARSSSHSASVFQRRTL